MVVYYFPQKYEEAQMFSTLIIIITVSWLSDHHIRVISEGSCDTEDWSNDAGHHRNKLHFTVYSHREQMIYTRIIFHIFTVFFIKSCSLGEQKTLF